MQFNALRYNIIQYNEKQFNRMLYEASSPQPQAMMIGLTTVAGGIFFDEFGAMPQVQVSV